MIRFDIVVMYSVFLLKSVFFHERLCLLKSPWILSFKVGLQETRTAKSDILFFTLGVVTQTLY